MGSASTRRISISVFGRCRMPETSGAVPSRYSVTPTIADECRGHRSPREPDRAFERRLDGGGGQRGAVGEHDAPDEGGAARPSPHPSATIARRARAPGSPASRWSRASRRRLPRPRALRSSRRCSARVAAIGFGIATTSVPPRGISSSRLLALASFSRSISARYAAAFAYSPRRLATVAASERSSVSASVFPIACAASSPRSAHRRVSSVRRPCQAVSAAKRMAPQRLLRLALSLEHRDAPLRLAQRGVRVAGHPMRLGQQEPRFPLERPVARPLLVLEELERGLRGADRVVRAERVERLARELQAVLDGLFGNVGLREVMDEVGIDRGRADPRIASRSARRTSGGASGACAARARRRGRRGRSRSRRRAGRRGTPAPLRESLRGPAGRSTSSRFRAPSASISRSPNSKLLPRTDATRAGRAAPREAARSASRPPAGSSPAARRTRSRLPFEKLQAPGVVAARSRRSRSSERSELLGEERIALRRFVRRVGQLLGHAGALRRPTRRASGARRARSGPSVIETNRGSSAKESSIRASGCRLSISVCR